MRCVACNAELSPVAKFCPDCGQAASSVPETPFVPASISFATQVPVAGPMLYQPGVAAGGYGQPIYGCPCMEESDYYHFDATEKLDFEALRGISIVLIILSVICIFTIAFPLPLAIIALVKSCSGMHLVDPNQAKKQFSTCRTLVIISIVTFVALFVLLLLIGLLTDPSKLSEYEKSGTVLLNMFR